MVRQRGESTQRHQGSRERGCQAEKASPGSTGIVLWLAGVENVFGSLPSWVGWSLGVPALGWALCYFLPAQQVLNWLLPLTLLVCFFPPLVSGIFFQNALCRIQPSAVFVWFPALPFGLLQGQLCPLSTASPLSPPQLHEPQFAFSLDVVLY